MIIAHNIMPKLLFYIVKYFSFSVFIDNICKQSVSMWTSLWLEEVFLWTIALYIQ